MSGDQTVKTGHTGLGLTTGLAKTLLFKRGVMTAQLVMKGNGIAAIEGVPGTGKTTCARYVAATAKRPCAIATMPHRPAPLDLLRHTYREVTGFQSAKNVTRFELQSELLEILADWRGVLIVDELQNTEASAMQELVWLYEETQHAFGLVIVGSTVLTAVKRHPQLATRIMGAVTFAPLRDQELLDTLAELDPRLRDTGRERLLRHDEKCARGLMRTWVKTIEWLDLLGIDSGPVPEAVLKNIRAALPQW